MGYGSDDIVTTFVPNTDNGGGEVHAFMRVNGKVTDIGGAVKDYQPRRELTLGEQVSEAIREKMGW